MKLSNELLKAKWAKEHYLEKLKARESGPTNQPKNIKVAQVLSYGVNWLSKHLPEEGGQREVKGNQNSSPKFETSEVY